MTQLRELAQPFGASLVSKAPQGKYGDYVKHSTVTERALSVVGPHSFEVVQLIRGVAAKVGQSEARDNAVVGCLARLSVTVDGHDIQVMEVGDVENPAMNNDGRNAKDASSDAYKRCWMRVGLGLHLWSGDSYFLPAQLDKNEETTA
jgi:hypothetical protein